MKVELMLTWESGIRFISSTNLYELLKQRAREIAYDTDNLEAWDSEHVLGTSYMGMLQTLRDAFREDGYLSHLDRKIVIRKKRPSSLEMDAVSATHGSPALIFEELSMAIAGDICSDNHILCSNGNKTRPSFIRIMHYSTRQKYVFLDDYYVWAAAIIFNENSGRTKDPWQMIDFLLGVTTGENIEQGSLDDIQKDLQGLTRYFEPIWGKNFFSYASRLESACSPSLEMEEYQPSRFVIDKSMDEWTWSLRRLEI